MKINTLNQYFKVNQNYHVSSLKNNSLGMNALKLRYSAVVSLLKYRKSSAKSSEGPDIFWRVR